MFRLDPLVVRGIPPEKQYEVFRNWRRALDNILNAMGVPENKRFSNLMAYGGAELQMIYYNLDQKAEEDEPDYKAAVQKLDDYFKPKHHAVFARHKFWKLTWDTDDTLDDVVLKMREASSHCKFGHDEAESLEIAMVDKLLMMVSQDLKEKLLQKTDLSFDKAIKIIKAHEATKYQVKELSGRKPLEFSVNAISKSYRGECYRCGSELHLADDQNCPARNALCNWCHKMGHYARKCPTKKGVKRSHDYQSGFGSQRSFKGQQSSGSQRFYANQRTHSNQRFQGHQEGSFKRRKLEEIRDVKHERSGEAEDSHKVSIFSINENGVNVVCKIGNVNISMMVDSGTTKNIVDENTWNVMLSNGFVPRETFYDASLRFVGYGDKELRQTIGFVAPISCRVKGKFYQELASFFVIKDGSQPLLSQATATALNILRIEIPDEKLVPINEVSGEKVQRPFPKMKGVQIHIPLKEGANPVQIPYRRAPVAFAKEIRAQLDELLALDIIEEVKESSAWVSALVPVVKNDGSIRLCVDLRRLNESIQRERHPLPVLEETLACLYGAVLFSKLDIKSAYHQCELDQESRPLTTFLTQWGMFRYKRMAFGISCAPEKFQKVMDSILAPCRNVICFIDDILVYGSTVEEHDECLANVLKVLNDHDVLLNTKKCEIRVKEVMFLGHKLSENGISPSDSKISAVQQFRSPKTKEEVRSFLGLVCYVGRFIPHLATITDPLRQLIKKEAVFEWGKEQEDAFNTIKTTVFTTLSYFDLNRKTRLVVDASPVGLGAILLQFKDNEPLVISYAAKSLTDTEKRYCQPEKEALALVWGVERFRYYLLGVFFELETDHKALETIFSKKSTTSARIERWVLRLQPFHFKVVYRKGKSNLADPLSRLAICEPEPFDEESEVYINQIKMSAAIDMKEVELASESDEELRLLKMAIEDTNFEREELIQYKYFKDQLSYVGNVVLKGDKVVVPSNLRQRYLELSHEGHPGL